MSNQLSLLTRWRNTAALLPNDDRLALYDALFDYVADGALPSLSSAMARLAFDILREEYDNLCATRQAISAKRAEAGRKGNEKRWKRKKKKSPKVVPPPPPEPEPEPEQQPDLFPELSPADDPLSFDRFWNTYNKKVGKPKAAKLYANLSLAERRQCMEYLPRYIRAIPDKQYRKNPETFLRNKSWNDEIITPLATQSKLILTDDAESRFENQQTW